MTFYQKEIPLAINTKIIIRRGMISTLLSLASFCHWPFFYQLRIRIKTRLVISSVFTLSHNKGWSAKCPFGGQSPKWTHTSFAWWVLWSYRIPFKHLWCTGGFPSPDKVHSLQCRRASGGADPGTCKVGSLRWALSSWYCFGKRPPVSLFGGDDQCLKYIWNFEQTW